ncbi:MAG TPA: SurA N-terminal domain-containing protein [Pyrinomonadaceae bacterium]|nr:SurA N-terminal domain-containing protein [Pyrinomonadaceae bacterium]
MQRTVKQTITAAFLAATLLSLGACSNSGSGSGSNDNTVAATVNGKTIMLKEVEQGVTTQAAGKQAQLSALELAQARLQVLGGLIQREVLFQRAEREKMLPTEDEITAFINQQKQQSGATDDDFKKGLAAQKMTEETYREEARKQIAISKLQDKYNSKITVNDKEVEDFYNGNRERFKSERGVALAMIMVDPSDNAASGITQNDAKGDAEAKLKIDNINQQLKGGADFATVARAKSEDANSVPRGGDIGFATEEQLKQNGFPADLVNKFFTMQAGDKTEPVQFATGMWYIFKLEEKRLQTENLTLESPGVRQQITQALTKQRSDILNAALLEVSVNESKVVNNMANTMLSNPSNLGLRPASSGSVPAAPPVSSATATPQAALPAAKASPAATTNTPKASASVKP